MMIPSSLVLFAGALVTAVLAAADWYVWGLNLANDPRQARSPQPLSGLELVDLGLGRLIAVHQAVLPKAAFVTTPAGGMAAGNDPDDGFKRVA
jgi:hypothetical protein